MLVEFYIRTFIFEGTTSVDLTSEVASVLIDLVCSFPLEWMLCLEETTVLVAILYKPLNCVFASFSLLLHFSPTLLVHFSSSSSDRW